MKSVIGDLTAIYSARQNFRKGINYKYLDEQLKKKCGVESWESTLFFTLFDSKNAAQVSFVNGLKELGWDIETVKSKDVLPWRSSPTSYRFNAQIAYELTSCEDDIVVITDSLDLLGVMKKVHDEDPSVNMTVAFFGEALDPRWHKQINDPEAFFKFIDLDELLYDS